MPNKRKADKRLVGFFASPEEKAAIEKLAKERGLTVAELLRQLATGALKLKILFLLGYIAAAHLTSSPTDWSAASLGASAKAGASLMIQHAAAAAEWVANKI